MSPEVSIIIPTYKRTTKLQRALQGIEQACTLTHEVIVIDDCPEGSAASVSLQFGAKYMCKSGREKGQSKSRNIGMRLATGRTLVFLDDDDNFVKHGVDILHGSLQGTHSIAFGNHSNVYADRRILKDLQLVTYDHLLICNQIPIGSYIIERSLIRRDFDETMRSHEDWDFLLYHMHGSKWIHVPEEVVSIDKTENRTTSTEALRRHHFWADFISIYSRYPAPHLALHRSEMLKTTGLAMDPSCFS
jgi:glycosyltransferase involved in cell wall biosynthesis